MNYVANKTFYSKTKHLSNIYVHTYVLYPPN